MRCEVHDKEFKGPNSRGNYWHVNGQGPDGKPIFCNKPVTSEYTPKMAEKASEIREKVTEPNWDEIARGKVRNSVAVAFIGQGIKVPGADVKADMEIWVDYIMNGVKEQTT